MKSKQRLHKLTLKWSEGSLYIWRHRALAEQVSICLFNCQNCETLPSLWQFPSLKQVIIHGFRGLTQMDDDFYGNGADAGQMPCLHELTVWDCPKINEIPTLPCNLAVLEVAIWKSVEAYILGTIGYLQLSSIDTLKSEVLPSNLKSFRLISCSNLTALPERLDYLLALELLEAWNFSQLMSLPESRLPLNLQLFCVTFPT
ncbi:conserved hypothetical protein [Ricinus communis]|uniref:R13L1/DRL21-like LRR repeat region domain-containing protein n=1 Tax=Ricinus communis TaxID=3988 RepID=B9STA3_RICCO|nr:conserved hypothetical protein [Ricinus communis]